MVMIKRRDFLGGLVGVILAHQLLNRKLLAQENETVEIKWRVPREQVRMVREDLNFQGQIIPDRSTIEDDRGVPLFYILNEDPLLGFIGEGDHGSLTLYDKNEARHRETTQFYQQFRSQKGIIYTTDYVLDETFTLLFKRVYAEKAKESIQILTKAFQTPNFNLIWIDKLRFIKAQFLRFKLLDKPSNQVTCCLFNIKRDSLTPIEQRFS